jgi:diguanylate cyclase (GGDEF)-like protein
MALPPSSHHAGDTLSPTDDKAALDNRLLMEVIEVQTAIAQQGMDLAGVMSLVTHRAQALTGAFGAVIELAEDNHMVYRSVSGIAAPMLGLRLDRNHSLSGLCVRENRILHCLDSESDERVDRDACRRIGLRSMIVVPLCHLGRSVGVLKVLSPQANGFSPAHARVLGLLSNMIGSAMFNAALFDASELYRRATHDALTGIPNRSLFFDRLRQAIGSAKTAREPLGVLHLDMDNLKPINDTHGHPAGDAALREFAQRLSGMCRHSDTVARLGGDEFAFVLFPGADRRCTEIMCERIGEQMARPLEFEGLRIRLDASIGKAHFPEGRAPIG